MRRPPAPSRATGPGAPLVSLEMALFVAVAVVAAAVGPAHAGWLGDADGLAAASRWSSVAGHGPGAILLGGLAALVPIGELATRVALVGGLALAAAAAGVVALTRALTPTAAGSGAVAASLLAIVPAADRALPTGEAALVTALAVWILVAVVRARRAVRDGQGLAVREAVAAACGVGGLLALAPVAAVALALVLATALAARPRTAARRTWPLLIAVALACAALLLVPLALRDGAAALADASTGDVRDLLAWVGPHPHGLAATVRDLGDGAGAILVLVGLIGLGLGAATGLPGATACGVAAIGLVVAAAASPGDHALPALAVLAVGLGPLTAAVSRLGPIAMRATIATVAAMPIAVIAALAPRGPVPGAERTAAVAQLAGDLLGRAPAGPGVFLAIEPAIHGALRVEQVIGGLRPDLALARRDRLGERRALAALDATRPELHVPRIDDDVAGAEDERLVASNLRAGLAVGSERSGFGRLDITRARPAGAGFALSLETDADTTSPAPPRPYPGPTGARLGGYLAVEQGRHQAARGRLEAAARAAGLAGRFGAADLAILDGAVLDPVRPPLLGFLPPRPAGELPPRWLLELFGDDLAWVGGLRSADLDVRAPRERRLHAAWRGVLGGALAPDDPSIRALGPDAARATARMLGDLGRSQLAERAARAVLATGEDGPTLLVLGSVLAERGGVGGAAAITDEQRVTLGDAASVLNRAVAASPRAVDARVVRGLVLYRLGRTDEARAVWQEAAQLAPGRSDVADLLRTGPTPADR